MEIEDVLNRRSDLSTFVVHFTRDFGGHGSKENLESILRGYRIRAETPMGWIKGVAVDQLAAAKVVCFSETPLEHAYSLVQKINRRQVALSPYGLAFTKAVARKKGVNPIWYVDMTPGQEAHWAIAKAIDTLRDEAKVSPPGFAAHFAAAVLPFIEQMGTWTTTEKEFWWEREWRHRGDFAFSTLDVTLVFCPEGDIDDMEDFGWPAVDPSWSLERMIEKLARTDLGSHSDRRARRRERAKADEETGAGR